ncbi:MAG: hypothetical protein GF409_04120 [Candidatus Omnitrophica bacterium]|nr:hypothetical protein [Candidatus Omnitrophota bacterium]
MKRTAFFITAALFVALLMPEVSHAGPWTLKKNKLWTETFFRYFVSKRAFDENGDRSRWDHGGISEIYDLEQKFEFGFNDNLNILLNIPYTWSHWKNDFSTAQFNSQKAKHEGFKQIQPGIKYKFMDKPVVAAGQLKFYIHPGNPDVVQQPDLFEYGNGVELRGLVGKSFTVFKKPAYVSGEFGYFWQIDTGVNADFANYFPMFLEGGISPFDWLMLKGELDVRLSHQGTGVRKDTITWRAGPIINLLGKGFSSVKKGAQSSLNLELQLGQTAWGRGDGTSERFRRVSAAWEYIAKVQILF